MAALPAGVSEWGGTAQGETLGETETETKGRREGQRGGARSQSKEALGAEVPAILGRQRTLTSVGPWVWARKQGSREEGQRRPSGPGAKRGRWLVSAAVVTSDLR